MGSQLLEVFRQGIWASLTGGWFHDPRQPNFANSVHLYLWLVLISFPLTLSIYFTSSILLWSIYSGFVGILFFTIKLLNSCFHNLFDTSEPIEEPIKEQDANKLSILESSETDAAKLNKRDQHNAKNLEVNESDEIELQVLDSITRPNSLQTPQDCLLDVEASNVPTELSTGSGIIGGDLKVDVHRNESPSTSSTESEQSSSFSSLHLSPTDSASVISSASRPYKIRNPLSKKQIKERNVDSNIPAIEKFESELTTVPQISSINKELEISLTTKYSSTATNILKPNNLSNESQSLAISTGSIKEIKEPKLTETASLIYIGNIKDKHNRQEFRRTQSALETNISSIAKNEQSETSNIIDSVISRVDPTRRSVQSLQSFSLKKPEDLNLKRSKSEESNRTKVNTNNENDFSSSEENEDEATRSRTPLLSRESVSKSPLPQTNKNKIVKLGKKVSFTMQSSTDSDSSTKYSLACPDQLSPNDLHFKEKKFMLVPAKDSLVGGQFTSDWLFQTVENPLDEFDKGHKESFKTCEKCDSESIKSEDSRKSSLGLNYLFCEEEPLEYSKQSCQLNQAPKKPPRASSSTINKISGSLPPPLSRKTITGRNRPYELESSHQSNLGRNEKETSPRVLERLLEESLEASPSSSMSLNIPSIKNNFGQNITASVSLTSNSSIINEPSKSQYSHHGLQTFGHRREVRATEPSHSNRNAFIQSAREIKNHIRNLGPHTSLDISGPSSSVERRGGDRDENHLQGLFRPRDESLLDIDSSSNTINRHRRLRRLAHSRRTLERRREAPYSPPLSSLQTRSLETHFANSHDDTTEGAIHYFQDESGKWFSYTFSEKGAPTYVPSDPPPPSTNIMTKRSKIGNIGSSSSESWSSISSSEIPNTTGLNRRYTNYNRVPGGASSSQNAIPQDSVNIISQNFSGEPSSPSSITYFPSLSTTTDFHPTFSSSALANAISGRNLGNIPVVAPRNWQRNPRVLISALAEPFLDRRMRYDPDNSSSALPISSLLDTSGTTCIKSKKQSKFYYLMSPLPCLKNLRVKIWFDRLNLMAVFDRNPYILENFLAICLAIGVALLGSFMLHKNYFQDLSVVLLCFVMAGSQFSLLKSVQPDASSPVHGFNRVVAFSRPIYFCIFGLIIYTIQSCLDTESYNYEWKLYGVDITNVNTLTFIRDIFLTLLLSFPLIFSIGLLPQFNTFLMFGLEQCEMHLFGGNAASSLTAATLSVFKSCGAVGLLYGFVYGAMSESESTQHLLFSIFCSILIPVSYHMSRCSSDPSVLFTVLKQKFCLDEDCFGDISANETKHQKEEDEDDPLPKKLRDTVYSRLKSDGLICVLIGLITLGLHGSRVFKALEPGLCPILQLVSLILGFILHYLIPQFRKELPCLLVAHPLLKPIEYSQYETRDAPKLMWFESLIVLLTFFEKNILYPLLILTLLTQESNDIIERFGQGFGCLVITITGLKALRSTFSDPAKNYLVLLFTVLFFKFDWEGYSERFLVDFFFMSILFHKMVELWLKLQFVITYIAPWQITWGSAFHAFAQPFSVPHSAMLFLQAVISSIISAPLNPFLGSAIFITSYMRPVKFWERDYNTKRVDHSNTRLSSHLEKNPGSDDNNLNSIFYEHLTRSLQHSLCGDLILGRWGDVSQGDCFVLASDYLNCLVHIIEVGNGLVTFQVRGLEFRGTYCQQREVEAISEGVDEDIGCCCCEPGHLPGMLSANAAFSQRWLAWEVTVSKYILEGYSISDHSATSMLQVYDLRKILITYYVKSVIYYILKAEKLEEWLEMESIQIALKPLLDKHYAELDPVFSVNIDQDYEFNTCGITRNSFCNVYYSWIQFCQGKRANGAEIDISRESILVSLCFGLSVLARRALGVAAHNSLSSVEFFLFGLHALFKGDFRITSLKDEWVFNDMDLLKKVVSPAVRMSLRLHQDHFMCPDEYDDHNALFDAINYHEENLVISHEGDPAWRAAVLAGRQGLLALRHVFDEGADEYKIIMLNKRYLNFRVIKLNRECVRGLWAGQQQELIYLRNRDPERGSIQNAKQALRNIINSSCDQPIGYPIYVSPLTTSYADTHSQLCSLIGGPISVSKVKKSVIALWRRLRKRCVEGCSSGSSSIPQQEETGLSYGQEGVYAMTNSAPILPSLVSSGINLSGSQSLDGSQIGGSSVSRSSLTRGNFNRLSVASISNVSGSMGKPSTSTLASLAGFLADANVSSKEKETNRNAHETYVKSLSFQRFKITDANQVYDGLNLGRRIDVLWPDETMKAHGGRSYWQNWVPEDGMEGVLVHKWVPGHRDPKCRSITDKTIYLLKIEDKFVPIAETGVTSITISEEVSDT